MSIVGVSHVGEVWTFGSAPEHYNITTICVERAREYRVRNNVIFQYTQRNKRESKTFFSSVPSCLPFPFYLCKYLSKVKKKYSNRFVIRFRVPFQCFRRGIKYANIA